MSESTKQDLLIRRNLLRWAQAHPQHNFYPVEANIAFLISALKGEPTPENFDAAFEQVKNSLAAKPVERPSEPVETPWPHKWCPPLYTVQDVRRMDGKMYRDLYFDKKPGSSELSERAKIFRSLVQGVLDKANGEKNR